ncbi:MAG: Fe-Mn family superoxide dismutase [Parcubacteria group bacterium]|jgi:Fe-Mn family superoxide dismutase
MYVKKDYAVFKGTPGFSDQALNTHFALYEGYVTNINKLNDILVGMEKEDKFTTPEYAELNRRFGWEWNGMRLHEYYFENLVSGGKAIDTEGELHKKMVENFGSVAAWEKDFRAMGAMRGIGWVVLYYDKQAGELFNVWISEHDGGHFAGATPLLVMDVFEHAYFPDYGKDRASYIDVFMKNVDWGVVEKRFA